MEYVWSIYGGRTKTKQINNGVYCHEKPTGSYVTLM